MASAEIFFVCGSSFSRFGASTVDAAGVVSGVEVELTDIGGAGSRRLDGEEGTDTEVATPAAYARRQSDPSNIDGAPCLPAWYLPGMCEGG